jgi:hypothetical protein
MAQATPMQKSLDQKLAAIHADPSGARDFIIADAKDADMAFGIGAPGLSPEAHAGELRVRTLAEYREQIRQVIRQGLVDIMLMSSSTSYALTIQERLFERSQVTPAARANDTSDIFVVRANRYVTEPSRPFRSASLDHIQCGHLDCLPDERTLGANLGLYSITFNNRLDEDLAALEEYRKFRLIPTPRRDWKVRTSPSLSTTRSSARWPAWREPVGRCFSRWSITVPRRWKSWSATTRTLSSESWEAAPAPPTMPSN